MVFDLSTVDRYDGHMAIRDDHEVLAFAMQPYEGWEFGYEHPGVFRYLYPASGYEVYFTPDYDDDGFVAVQAFDDEGRPLDDGAQIPFSVRTPDALFAAVRPWLDKYQPSRR